MPPQCEKLIQACALVAINHSGGKNSPAMTILLSQIVPHDQLVAVYAPFGDVELPDTVEHIDETLPAGVSAAAWLFEMPAISESVCDGAGGQRQSVPAGPKARSATATPISAWRLTLATVQRLAPFFSNRAGCLPERAISKARSSHLRLKNHVPDPLTSSAGKTKPARQDTRLSRYFGSVRVTQGPIWPNSSRQAKMGHPLRCGNTKARTGARASERRQQRAGSRQT